MEHRSDVGVGGHIELYVRGAVVAIHHVTEVLASAEGLGHGLRRWLNVVETTSFSGYGLLDLVSL